MKKLLCIVSTFLIISCSQDVYDKGEGKYSLLRGDFAEAVVNSNQQVTKIVTDDGDELSLTAPYTAKWVSKADTTYRCMLYYNKVRDAKGQYTAEPISVGMVPCPKIGSISELETPMKTDPVRFESAWISKTGKYLNLSLILMTGTTEVEDAIHTLRVLQDTIIANPDGSSTSHILLYHDQGGVPEYYSTPLYASIITSQIPADSVRITINTYKGIIEKAFLIKR